MHSHHPRKETVPAPVPGEPVMPEDGAALARWGAIAITLWYLGGFVLLMIGMVAGIGPTTAVQGWMTRHLGWDSPVTAFLPAFAVLALPLVLLQLVPRQTAHPFLRGAQDAFSRGRDPGADRGATDADVAARLRVRARVMLAIAAAALMADIVAFAIVARRPAGAGQPLPRRSIAQLLADPGPLPDHVRLVGLNPGTRPIWIRLWSIRQTAYEDIYFPLDDASSRSAAQVVGLASFVRGTDEEPHGRDLILDLPMDGSLTRTSLPAWQREEMARRGFAAGDPVILFKQDRTLGGVQPGRDLIGGIAVLAAGGCAALVALAMAVVCFVARGRLIRASVPARPGRRRP